MNRKRCNHCKNILDFSSFGNNRTSPDGKASRCLSCSRNVHKKSYYKDVDSKRQKNNIRAKNLYQKDPKASARKARERRKDVRIRVLDAYGGKCTCCGETIESFLTIDHINGGGNKHRKSVGNSSTSVYYNIIKEGFPKDKYQILCFNCNRSKFVLGKCEHTI